MLLQIVRLTIIIWVFNNMGGAHFLFSQVRLDAVKWSYRTEPTSYKEGETITLIFDATIDPGYKIYSVIPYKNDGPLPTELGLDKETKNVAVVGKLTEDFKPKKKYEEVFSTDVFYFEGKATFRQKIKITGANAKAVGYISFMVCDSGSCMPGTYNFSIPLSATAKSTGEITPAPTDSNNKMNSNLVTNDATIKKVPEQDNPATDKSKQAVLTPQKMHESESTHTNTSFFWLFLEAFGAGIIALFTPCVYPMIPMTVSYFTKKHKKFTDDAAGKLAMKKQRREGIRKALFYSASIVFIYVALGLAVTVIFGSSAIYELASNPWLNLFFFLMLFVFGLSFLGFFEISLPTSWVNAADTKVDKGGFTGIFFMALTLVLVSFSCTGPIVGTQLVLASQGSFFGPVIGMLGFSLAFAVPFGLFAVFPEWLVSLPKSGSWLNSVKISLGILELALSLKFLSNADMVWHWEILNREVFLGLWIGLFLLLALYLLGFLLVKGETSSHGKPISPSRLLLGTLVLSFVLYLLPGLWGARLKLVSGFLPSYSENSGFGLQSQLTENPAANAVCNLPRKYADKLAKDTPKPFCAFFDIAEAQAYARKVNKPLLLDFTGHSCVNCRNMEQNVWTDPAIQQVIMNDYILVSLYADDATPLPEVKDMPDGTRLRTLGNEVLYLQKQRYNQIAQPYYVLTDPELNLLATPRGFNLDQQSYLAFLKEGIANFEKKVVMN
jgi:thiol:disulfide interchange protein DsbD